MINIKKSISEPWGRNLCEHCGGDFFVSLICECGAQLTKSACYNLHMTKFLHCKYVCSRESCSFESTSSTEADLFPELLHLRRVGTCLSCGYSRETDPLMPLPKIAFGPGELMSYFKSGQGGVDRYNHFYKSTEGIMFKIINFSGNKYRVAALVDKHLYPVRLFDIPAEKIEFVTAMLDRGEFPVECAAEKWKPEKKFINHYIGVPWKRGEKDGN